MTIRMMKSDDDHHDDDKNSDGDADYHRSIPCITNAASEEMMMIARIMMIGMRTVMIAIIAASSALPMVPNSTLGMYVNETDDDDHHDDEGQR